MQAEIKQFQERIETLEEHNNFTPDKMSKIHNALDIEFTASEQELLSKKASSGLAGVAQLGRDLRVEINKLKD